MSKTHKPMRYNSLVSALLYPSSPIPQECAHGTFISNVNYLRKKFETTTSMTTRNWQRQFCIYHGDTEQQDSVFHQCKPREPMETLYNKIVLSTNASHSKVIAQRSDEPRKEDTEEQDGVSVLTCYKSNNNGWFLETPKNKMVISTTRATPADVLTPQATWRYANGGRSKCKRSVRVSNNVHSSRSGMVKSKWQRHKYHFWYMHVWVFRLQHSFTGCTKAEDWFTLVYEPEETWWHRCKHNSIQSAVSILPSLLFLFYTTRKKFPTKESATLVIHKSVKPTSRYMAVLVILQECQAGVLATLVIHKSVKPTSRYMAVLVILQECQAGVLFYSYDDYESLLPTGQGDTWYDISHSDGSMSQTSHHPHLQISMQPQKKKVSHPRM